MIGLINSIFWLIVLIFIGCGELTKNESIIKSIPFFIFMMLYEMRSNIKK